MSAFFCKNLPLFVQNSTSNPSNSVRAVLEIFSSVFSFCKKKGCYYWKHNFWRLCVQNPASGLIQIDQKSEKWQWRHDFPTWHQSQVVLFLLSSLVTGFMSISSLVLELWQSSFIRDWPEIRKSEIPPCEFCPISGDWGELCF